jgi:hypothetical protein
MRPTGHVDIAAAGLNADMMSINFSTDRRRKASAMIGCCRVLKN